MNAKSLPLIIIFMSFVFAKPADAFDNDTDNSPEALFTMSLEELSNVQISSAAKHEQNLGSVAGNVTIITRKQIAQYGCTTLEELFAYVPGVFLVDTYEDQLIGMRGTIGGGVQFLVNNVPVHPARTKGLSVPERSRFNIPINAIDRIEIVRGPKSVIYGNNAFLGSVNIITASKDSQGSSIRAGVGTRTTGHGSIRTTHHFSSDAFIVTNAQAYHTDGINRYVGDSMSDNQLADLHPNTKLNLDKMLKQNHFNGEIYGNYKGLWTDLRYSKMDYGFYAFTPGFDHGTILNSNTINLSAGYFKTSKKNVQLKFYSAFSRETYDFEPDWIKPNTTGYQHQHSNRGELEISVNSPLWHGSNLLIGYNLQGIWDAQNNYTFTSPDYSNRTQVGNVWRNDLFSQLEQQLFKKVTLSAGIRVSLLSPFTIEKLNFPTSAPSAISKQTLKHAQNNELYWVPRAAIVWQPTKQHAIKGIYSTAIQNSRDISLTEPEKIQSGELIYWFAFQKFSAQLSGFMQQTDRLARRVQSLDENTGNYIELLDNSGSYQTLGVEMEVSATPTKSLCLNGSVTLQDTKDLHHSKIEVGNSPAWLAKFKTSYAFRPINNDIITISAAGQFVDKMKTDWQWTDKENKWMRIGNDVPAWFIASLNIKYQHVKSGLMFNLHGSNVFNRDVRYPTNELVNFKGGSFAQGRRLMLTTGLDW